MNPSVSVLIPAWNAAGYIRTSVESALSQEGVDVEVVIVDDCSSDDTFALANRLAQEDRRVRVLRTQVNGGSSVARNLGLASITSTWCAILDADDSFAPGRLQRLVAFADRERLDIAFDTLRFTDPAGRPLPNHDFWPSEDFDGGEPWTLAYFAGNNRPYRSKRLIGYLKPLLRMDFIRRHGVAYDPSLRNSQDYMFIIEALYRGARAAAIRFPGYNYAIRPDSASGSAILPERQQALIDAEQRFLDSFSHGMSESDRAALVEHIHCLKLAMRSDSVFDAIRKKSPMSLAAAIARHPADAPVQLNRIARSAFRKISGRKVMRGG